MGKVYDALRRAEEERNRNLERASALPSSPPLVPSGTLPSSPPLVPSGTPPEGPSARPIPPPEGPAARPMPTPAASVPAPERPSFWRRLLRRGAPRPAVQGADLNKRRIALLQPESHVAEQFRTLRARIESIAVQRRIHTIAVTSAMPGDGKTMAAVSLAVVSSMQPGRRVLLVECDLRHPSIHRILGLRADAGLAEVLEGKQELEEAIQRVEGSDLEVLPVRWTPSNPAELLASRNMAELLQRLAARYDRVILDLPPALGLPDAKIVSELCDGVVFVVRAGRTPQNDVETAIELLERRRILGLVLNGSETVGDRYSYRS